MVALGFWNRPPAGTGIGLCSVRKRKTPSDSSGAKGEKVEGDGEEEDEDEVDILMRGYHRGERFPSTASPATLRRGAGVPMPRSGSSTD